MNSLNSKTTALLVQEFEAPALYKLAILFLENAFASKILSIACFLYSQTQMFCVLINTALLTLRNDSTTIKNVFETIVEAFSIGGFLDLDQVSSLTSFVVSFILIFLALETILSAYLLISIRWQKTPLRIAQKTWVFCLFFHPTVVFYPFHYIGVRILFYLRSDSSYTFQTQFSNSRLQTICFVSLAFNAIYGALAILFFKSNVKTKDVLSNKTRQTDFIDFLIKLLSPILWFFCEDEKFRDIALLVINALWAIIKDLNFFQYLPYYNIEILKIAVKIHAATTLFVAITLVTKIKMYIRFEQDLAFLLFFWAVLLPLNLKFYNKGLQRVLINSVLHPDIIKNPYRTLTYWTTYKYLSKSFNKPRLRDRSVTEQHFFYNILLKNSEAAKNPALFENLQKKSNKGNNVDLEIEKAIDAYFYEKARDLLRAMVNKHPNSWLLKGNLAARYKRFKGLSIIANQLIEDGLKAASLSLKGPSLYFIKFSLLKIIRHQTFTDGNGANDEKLEELRESLNVEKYIKLNALFEKMKKGIIAQLKPQVSFWEDYQTNEPELTSLIDNSVEVHEKSKKMEKYLQYHDLFVESNFIKPILVYGFYSALVNHDFGAGIKKIREYYRIDAKIKLLREEDNDMFHYENFHINSMYFAVSGDYKKLGRVLDCSGSVENFLGVPKIMVVGKNISSIMPHYFAEKHDNLIKASYEKQKFSVLDKIREVPVKDQSGFIVPSLIHVSLNFLPEIGLCYYGLIKTLKDERRVILIDQDGQVTNYTENFALDMGIQENVGGMEFEISHFCPDMQEAITTLMPQRKKKNKTTFFRMSRPTTFKSSNYTPMRSGVTIMSKKHTKFLSSKMSAMSSNNRFQKLTETCLIGDNLTFYPLNNRKTKGSDALTGNSAAACTVYHITVQLIVFEDEPLFECKMEKAGTASTSQNMLGRASIATSFTAMKTLRFFNAGAGARRASKFEPNAPNNGSLTSMNSFDIFRAKTIQSDFSQQNPPAAPAENNPKMQRKSIFRPRGMNFQINEEDNQGNRRISIQLVRHDSKGERSTQDKFLEALRAQAQKDEQNLITNNTAEDGLLVPKKQTLQGTKTSLIDEESEEASDDQSVQQDKGDFGRALKTPKGDNEVLSFNTTNRPSVVNDGESGAPSNQAIIDSTVGQADILQEIEMDLIKEIMGEDSIEEKAQAILKAKAIAIQKSVQNVLKTRTFEKATMFYYFTSSISILLQLAFVLWINFYVSSSTNEAQNTEEILQSAYFRDFWIKIANEQTRLWVNARRKDITILENLEDLNDQNLLCNSTFHELSSFNQDLRLLLGSANSDIQDLFYIKNVDVYDRVNDDLIFQSTDNPSQVTDKIITKGFANFQKELPTVPESTIDPESRFIFDNSFNDLLVKSELTLLEVEEKSSQNLKDAKLIILIVLAVTLGVLGLFVIFSIHSMIKLNKEYLKFMNVLCTIPKKDAAKTQVILTAFEEQLLKDCDDEDFIRGLTLSTLDLRIRRSQSTGMGTEREKKGYRRITHKASMRKLYIRNRITFGGLFSALFIMIVLMIVYYTIALDKMSSFEIQTSSKVFILKALNRQVFVNTQVQALIMDNDATKVRNLPILENLDSDLSVLYNINAFQESLYDDQGELSQDQQAALYNITCSEAYSSLYFLSRSSSTSICNTISKGIGRLSLTSLLPDIVNNVGLIIEDYEGSTKDNSSLQLLFDEAVSMLNDLSDITATLMLLLFTATEAQLQEKVDSLNDTSLIVICVAIAVSIILGLLTWIFVIKKLVDRSFERRRVLAIIPNRLITTNPYLKMYLFVLSKDNNEGVQHFMNS